MIPQGTPSYLAPEVVKAWFSAQELHAFTDRIDIFSLGALAVHATTGKYPFRRLTRRLKEGDALSSREFESQFNLAHGCLQELETVSPTLAHMVELCLQRDPAKRPGARALLGQLVPPSSFGHAGLRKSPSSST